MKIIENAMKNPIEITCPECNSVLEYTYKDIERQEENGFFGTLLNCKKIHCFRINYNDYLYNNHRVMCYLDNQAIKH